MSVFIAPRGIYLQHQITKRFCMLPKIGNNFQCSDSIIISYFQYHCWHYIFILPVPLLALYFHTSSIIVGIIFSYFQYHCWHYIFILPVPLLALYFHTSSIIVGIIFSYFQYHCWHYIFILPVPLLNDSVCLPHLSAYYFIVHLFQFLNMVSLSMPVSV